MKAIVKQSPRPDSFAVTMVPIPDMSENELLIRVKAIGVGIHDGYFMPANIQFPYPIGIEAAGIIEKKGREVANFQEGERVAFVSAMQPKGGTWAEYAVVAGNSLIFPIPPGMGFTDAAAIPVAGNTILRVLHALDLKPGESLFIAGASGAIGTFAIQLAVERGCTVAASASQKNHAHLISLGAAKAVDYQDADWVEQIRAWSPGGVDVAIAIQPNTGIASMRAVRDGGKIISVSGEQLVPERGITVVPLPYDLDVVAEVAKLAGKVMAGDIRLFIEKIYPFSEGLEALRKASTRHARGKLLITVP